MDVLRSREGSLWMTSLLGSEELPASRGRAPFFSPHLPVLPIILADQLIQSYHRGLLSDGLASITV